MHRQSQDRSPYEFGCGVSIATPLTAQGHLVLNAKPSHGNPYDGYTLGTIVADLEKLAGMTVRRVHGNKAIAVTTIPTGSRSGS